MKIIKYQLETEINYGTPEEPDIETLLSPVTVTYTEEAYAIAQAEAFQGQITVEDDGKPEPEPKPEYVTYAELAEAIREGVNEVWRTSSLYLPPCGIPGLRGHRPSRPRPRT